MSQEERVLSIDEVEMLEFTKEKADTKAMLRLHEEAMRLRLQSLEADIKRLEASPVIEVKRPEPRLPMLASVVHGVHPPVVREYVRRIRVDESSALAGLRAAYEKYETKEED